MAMYEFNSGLQDKSRSGIFIVKKYLPVPVLLSVVLGLMIWLAGEFKPISHELVAIIISFYLTATTGLHLMSRLLAKPQV
jgi:FtsH-binding integral membrane protein